MYYILDSNVGLRSWWLVPYAYSVRNTRVPKMLSKAEFDFLSFCDGNTDLPENELAQKFLSRGMISPCAKGEKQLIPWQKMECNNRCFPAINWMITGKCNYNCRHCFNAADNAPLMSEFTLEQAESLLDQAAACGVNAFTITGGEPMCHKNFFDIIEGIYKRNMFVEEINTNGHYITRETLDRMKAIGCNPEMKISFDGLGHHDWLRNRKGAEEDALRAMQLCLDNGFRVKAQTNVHRLNVNSMLPTVRLLDEMGVQGIRIIRTSESPRWKVNAGDACLDFDEYFDRMLELVEELVKEDHKIIIDIWLLMTLAPARRKYGLRAIQCCEGDYHASRPVCPGNRSMTAVSANGNVFPCMQMSGFYELHNLFLGNVHTDGLQSLLLRGPYLDEVCTTVGELAQINPECGQCRYFKYCLGGCRAMGGLGFTDSKMGKDITKCIFFQKGYYQKIEKIMDGWKNLTPLNIL
jgi:radical SAM protein with 4Fe4S-binding SPASM domain